MLDRRRAVSTGRGYLNETGNVFSRQILYSRIEVHNMKGIGVRPILFAIIVIAMWIASALLLVAGFSFFEDGKTVISFATLSMAALLGFLGFKIQLKVLAKVFSKMLLANNENPAIDENGETNAKNKIEPPTDTMKAASDAPNLAGYTLSYSYNDVKLSGCEDNNTRCLQAGDDIVFLHEKDNPDDKDAVSAIVSGTKIGYMNKDRLRDMYHDFSAQNGLVLGSVLKNEPITPTISIRYYKNDTENFEYYEYLKSGQAFETFMLTSNKNEEMQENISSCSIGDEVELNYDYDEDKYTAYCFEEIGVFPKSENSILEHSFKAFVERIEQNNEDEYQIYIAVFKG